MPVSANSLGWRSDGSSAAGAATFRPARSRHRAVGVQAPRCTTRSGMLQGARPAPKTLQPGPSTTRPSLRRWTASQSRSAGFEQARGSTSCPGCSARFGSTARAAAVSPRDDVDRRPLSGEQARTYGDGVGRRTGLRLADAALRGEGHAGIDRSATPRAGRGGPRRPEAVMLRRVSGAPPDHAQPSSSAVEVAPASRRTAAPDVDDAYRIRATSRCRRSGRATAVGSTRPDQARRAHPEPRDGLHELRRDLARDRSTVAAASASASSVGRVVRVRDRDDRHAGRVRRAHPVRGVLDRDAPAPVRRRAARRPRGRRRAPACRAGPPRRRRVAPNASRTPATSRNRSMISRLDEEARPSGQRSAEGADACRARRAAAAAPPRSPRPCGARPRG